MYTADMKNLLKLALLLAVFITHLVAQSPASNHKYDDKPADKSHCGIIYGESVGFMVCAPKGWTVDSKIGSQYDMYAVYYPDGSSWDLARQSGSVMCITIVDKPDDNATVEQLMAIDADVLKRNVKSAVVKKGEPIQLGDISVPVQLFVPGGFNRYQAQAYVDSPKVVITFIMNSVSEDAFKRDYPDFVKLIQSYVYLDPMRPSATGETSLPL